MPKYLNLLLLLSLCSFCIGDQWLMQGDFISESEASRRGLDLSSTNSTTSVSSSMRLTLTSPPGHQINCLMAASLHMNGHVELVAGGLGSNNATLGYETIAGRPDLLFVQIESHASNEPELLRVAGNAAETSRVTILYDQLKDWLVARDRENDTARENFETASTPVVDKL